MQLQTLVDAARTAAASPDSAAAASLSPAALLTNISRLAAVQQGDMVAGIATLSSDISTGYAADPAGYDPTTKLAAFLQVRMQGRPRAARALLRALHATSR